MIDHSLIAVQEQTSYACPDQWQGTLIGGQHFYFRYRSGWASLGLGATPHAAVADPAEVGVGHGDGLQGVFESDDDRSAVFAKLLARRLPIGGRR